MLYSDFVTGTCTLLEVPVTDATAAAPTSDVNYNNVLPMAITYVEQRLQKDFDLIATVATDSSASLTPNSRSFVLPTDVGTFVVVQQATIYVNGNRLPPMLPASREFLDFSYPSEQSLGTPCYPKYWCPVDGQKILVGPAADVAYPCEITGTVRIQPLSSANTSNWLSVNLPELYLILGMVWFSGYQRDYGSQADDPKMAMSWENQYQLLKSPTLVEEVRKKFQGVNNSSRSPSPLAPAA